MKKETIVYLKDKTEELLEEVGVKIPDEKLLKDLEEKGFLIDYAEMTAKIPRKLLRELLSQVPETFHLYYRDLEKYIVIGDGETKFMPSGTGLAVKDYETGERRDSTSKDIRELVTVQNYLENVDIVRPLVSALDFAPNSADYVEFYEILRNTNKPFLHRTLHEENIDDIMKMAGAVVGGLEKLKEKPTFYAVYTAKSPLLYTSENIRSMIKYAQYGIPTLALSMTMGGATAPVTILGQVLQANAETLAGIAFVQAFVPGAPMLYGNVASVVDMRTVILALGAPERSVLNSACAELAMSYKIPNVAGGTSSDGKEYDEQTGFEKAITTIPLMGKASIIYGMGNMDSSNTYSLLQLIIDDEFVSAIRKMHDFDFGDDVLEEMAILKEKGANTNFLEEEQTLHQYKNYWVPDLSTRDSYVIWEQKKGSFLQSAKKKALALLEKGVPELEENRLTALQALYKKGISKI